MKLSATLFKLGLSNSQSDQVNNRGWKDTLFGQAYLDLSMLGDTLKTSDLYTALDLGLYRPAKRYRLEAYHAGTGCDVTSEDLEAAADAIYSRDNNPTARDAGVDLVWHDGKPSASLSVGDLLAFNLLPEGPQSILVCASMGWQTLSKIQRDLVMHSTAEQCQAIELRHRLQLA